MIKNNNKNSLLNIFSTYLEDFDIRKLVTASNNKIKSQVYDPKLLDRCLLNNPVSFLCIACHDSQNNNRLCRTKLRLVKCKNIYEINNIGRNILYNRIKLRFIFKRPNC